MDTDIYKNLQKKFPFLSIGTYLDEHHCGIIQNSDNQFVSMYCYDQIHDVQIKKAFIKYGEVWWWESNHQIPINIFFGSRFKIFRQYLRSFVKKDFELLIGPMVSLGEPTQKRSKRRQISLINKNCYNDKKDQ